MHQTPNGRTWYWRIQLSDSETITACPPPVSSTIASASGCCQGEKTTNDAEGASSGSTWRSSEAAWSLGAAMMQLLKPGRRNCSSSSGAALYTVGRCCCWAASPLGSGWSSGWSPSSSGSVARVPAATTATALGLGTMFVGAAKYISSRLSTAISSGAAAAAAAAAATAGGGATAAAGSGAGTPPLPLPLPPASAAAPPAAAASPSVAAGNAAEAAAAAAPTRLCASSSADSDVMWTVSLTASGKFISRTQSIAAACLSPAAAQHTAPRPPIRSAAAAARSPWHVSITKTRPSAATFAMHSAAASESALRFHVLAPPDFSNIDSHSTRAVGRRSVTRIVYFLDLRFLYLAWANSVLVSKVALLLQRASMISEPAWGGGGGGRGCGVM
jgi:hypothetical protein